MARAFRILAALIALISFGWSHTHAQVPMTGAGRGAPAAAGGGNVTPDVVGTEKFQATSNLFSYTGLTITGGLTNPGLICVLQRAHASNDVAAGIAMTWNGAAMALRSQTTSSGVRVAAIFGLRNPASGNQTLAVSGTNVATDNFVNCVSFSNVNPASDVAAFPNPTNALTSMNIPVTSAAGHYAIGSYWTGSGIANTLGNVIYADNTNGGIVNAGGDYVQSVGASTSVGSSSTSMNEIAGVDVSN